MKESNMLPRNKQRDFSPLQSVQAALGLIDPPIQGIMGLLSRGLKRSLCEIHRLHAAVPTIRMSGVTLVHPPYAFMACCLIKITDKSNYLYLFCHIRGLEL